MNKIKWIRLQLELTQIEFGALIGVSGGMISQIEKGKRWKDGGRTPSLYKVMQILKVCRANDIPMTAEELMEEL